MKSQIAAFRNRKFEIANSKSVKQQRQVEGAQTVRNNNRCDFWGAISNRSVSAFSKLQHRSQKINANSFCTKVFNNPSAHGRLRRKSWTSALKSAFSCGTSSGEKLFDPWASGRKGQECPREIRTKKFMFMLLFFPEL